MPTKIEKDQLSGQYTTGHEWDGLKELNTPLPKWWLYVFYACIAFAVVWVIAYPSVPVRGVTGVTGWIAREAVVQDVARQNAAREPMLARLRTAGATSTVPAAPGIAPRATAAIATAPPMLSPATKTGTPAWRASTMAWTLARSAIKASLPAQIPGWGARPKPRWS